MFEDTGRHSEQPASTNDNDHGSQVADWSHEKIFGSNRGTGYKTQIEGKSANITKEMERLTSTVPFVNDNGDVEHFLKAPARENSVRAEGLSERHLISLSGPGHVIIVFDDQQH